MRYPLRSVSFFFRRYFFLLVVIKAIGQPVIHAEIVLPKLAVVIAVDQLRGDYIARFGPNLSDRGFKRLLANGAVFEDCHYRHAVTKTAPGHATILSGSHPTVHGIVANEWLDRASWQVVESVADPTAPLVGSASSTTRSPGGVLEAKSGRSPRRFLATTVGDQLKLRFNERSKVFAVANKDRSAILLGGKLADSAYWIERGRFVTSTYYRSALPSWIEVFNGRRPIEAVFGKTWERLLNADVYEAVQGPDDAPGESALYGLGRTFPQKIDGGRPEISPHFYTAFDHSPFSTALIGEFAQAAIREEKLGRNSATDLLCIGFSQIDTVGHGYGPDSHELMDSVLRLDDAIGALLDCIEKEVGLSRCVIVLTADHGVSPLPERVQSSRPEIPAGRFDAAALDQAVIQALDQAFGPLGSEQRWITRDNFGYHLRPEALAAKKLLPSDATRVVKLSLLASPQIAFAFTRDDVLAMSDTGAALSAMQRRSFYPGRSQDVVYVLKPYLVDRAPTGTNHGSPYAYDTHVPLLFFGLGVPPGVHHERVGVDDLAPTLAALLGLSAPPEAGGHRLF